jgi:hypothetical protein
VGVREGEAVAVGVLVRVTVGGKIEVEVRVGEGPLVGGAFVFVGVKIITLVGIGIKVCVLVGLDILVLVFGGIKVNVLVGDGVGGTGVAKEAPGVRKTSIQAGLVRIDGSRGSKKLTGTFVRKSLSGLRFDPMFEFSFQLGVK